MRFRSTRLAGLYDLQKEVVRLRVELLKSELRIDTLKQIAERDKQACIRAQHWYGVNLEAGD